MSSSARHVIRLREPWEVEVPAESTAASQNQNHPTAIRFRRRFGAPTGLGAHDEVDLVIDGIAINGRAWLNEQMLGDLSRSQSARFSILRHLAARNELRIDLNLSELSDSRQPATSPVFTDFIREVRLEILPK